MPLFEKSNAVPLSKVPAPGANVSLAPSDPGPVSTGAGSSTGGSCLMLLAVVARST